MNAYQFRDLAIKLLGLFYLVRLILVLPQIANAILRICLALSSKYPDLVTDWFCLAGGVFSSEAIIFAIAAYIFLRRTDWVQSLLWRDMQDGDTQTTPMSIPLATGVSLIGLFFVMEAIGPALFGIFCRPWLQTQLTKLSDFVNELTITNLITLLVSLLCVFQSHRIAAFLTRKYSTPISSDEDLEKTQ